ncbi:MAG: hypothetical protein KAT52_03015 [Desulfobacterales bacterium]|nr:hypothetical protein [Desulfobacterales bacterium]
MKFERRFQADLLVENKAIKKIINQNEAQLINYLKTTRLRVGLLIIQCNSVKIRGELFTNFGILGNCQWTFQIFQTNNWPASA